MSYETGGAHKFWEEDSFESGNLPNTGGSYYIGELSFKADSIPELLVSIKSHFGCRPDDIQIDACEEPGRIDVQVLENNDGMSAREDEIAAWKHGDQRLWDATYTFYVEHVVRTVVPLAPQT